MIHKILLTVLAASLVSATGLEAQPAGGGDEQQLVAVLQSDHSAREKDAACAALKRIGTDACVPALAALLADEQLSHSARLALESMPSSKAEDALLNALPKTGGLIRIGIIDSLGFRGGEKAAPALIGLLEDPDAATAAAAAEALGQVGGLEEVAALQKARARSAAPSHQAIDNALLRCAVSLSASRRRVAAQKIFQDLYDTGKSDSVRVASYRGLIEVSSDAQVLMIAAITGGEPDSQMAALQLVREVDAPGATKAFAGLLPGLEPPVQIALIGGLAQRKDASAIPALLPLAGSADADVRLATIKAFDEMGDASVVPILVTFAVTGNAAEKKSARAALLDLPPGGVTQALLKELAAAQPDEQLELGRLLGERADAAAVPPLLKIASDGPASARAGALQALTVLDDGSSVPSLLSLALWVTNQESRAQAAEALQAIFQRIESKGGHVDGAALLQAFKTDSIDTRVALIPVGGGLIDDTGRRILREAVRDADPRIREAGMRELCATRDAELLPDLVRLAGDTSQENFRLLAIRGCVRLMTQEEGVNLPDKTRIAAFKSILSGLLNADEKRAILAGLAAVPDQKALEMIVPFVDDTAVRKEAIRAVIQVTATLPDAREAAAVLEQALAKTDDPETRQAGQRVLKQLAAKSAAGASQNK
jgi:HEAT repeat protein